MQNYRYDIVQDALDDFVAGLNPIKHAPFLRAVRWLYRIVVLSAEEDYAEHSDDPEQRLAWAWEDAHMAFLGLSEHALQGPVLQMWHALRHSRRQTRRLRKTLRRALREAERHTHVDAPRRYPIVARRLKPVEYTFDDPAEGDAFSDVQLPVWGPVAEVYCARAGEDPEEVADFAWWREERERARQRRLLLGEWRGRLRVLDGGAAPAPRSESPAATRESR